MPEAAGTRCPSDDLLSSYLAHALSDGERAAVAEHLRDCVTCSAVVELAAEPESLAGARSTPAAGAQGSAPENGAGPPRELRAGDTLGRYVISHRIGAGGMGVVWAAYDPELDRHVAIKVMRSDSAAVRARFEREVAMTARLQHPAIVGVIEAGRWPSGEPYYVMELVRGQPLDRVLADAHAASERLPLLPRIMVVAEAVAYAHDLGIIHRDLKPQNVLLGDFGETVLIDWGLAKAVGDADDGHAMIAAAPEQTALGAVIGTPSYMSPEQARGAALDQRADVYALGAMLYHVLAGTRPYDDVDGPRVLEAVLSGPPRPLRECARDLPGDLVSIVDRAMAREASERYPTARELVAELRRFLAGELVASHRYTAAQIALRWVERHRAALAVAVLASLALVVVGVLGVVRVTEQKQHAEERRAQAEELLDFMVFDLHDKLERMGRLDILGDVARRAELHRLDADSTDLSPEALARRSAMLINLGEVLLDEGDATAALERYRRAMELARRAVDGDPSSAKLRRHLAKTGGNLGDALLTTGAADEALDAYRHSFALVEKLAAEAPDDPQRAIDLAHVHGDMSDAYVRKRDGASALRHARARLALAGQAVAAAPDDAEFQHKLALAHMSVGRVLIDQSLGGGMSDMAGAATAYEASAAIFRKLEASAPPSPHRRTLLAGCLRNLGIVREEQGDDEGALAIYRQAAQVVRSIADDDPADAYLQRDVAAMHYQIGKMLVRQGDGAEAARELEQGLDILLRLTAGDPANKDWQISLAYQWVWLGYAQLAAGDEKQAEASFQAARELADRELAAHPDDPDWDEVDDDVRAAFAYCCAKRDPG